MVVACACIIVVYVFNRQCWYWHWCQMSWQVVCKWQWAICANIKLSCILYTVCRWLYLLYLWGPLSKRAVGLIPDEKQWLFLFCFVFFVHLNKLREMPLKTHATHLLGMINFEIFYCFLNNLVSVTGFIFIFAILFLAIFHPVWEDFFSNAWLKWFIHFGAETFGFM